MLVNPCLLIEEGRYFSTGAEVRFLSIFFFSSRRRHTRSDLTEWMIGSSSNLATNLLLDYVTVEEAQKVLRDAGVSGIELRRGVDDTKAHEQNFNNETTADSLLQLFAVLRGDFLSKASREMAINILLQQRFNSMIPAPLPSHASVAHKTGEISTACHDAGIVYLPEREPYILVVLTEVAAETNGRREAIAKISEVVFQSLVHERFSPRHRCHEAQSRFCAPIRQG